LIASELSPSERARSNKVNIDAAMPSRWQSNAPIDA
jgi:hypothetical protein